MNEEAMAVINRISSLWGQSLDRVQIEDVKRSLEAGRTYSDWMDALDSAFLKTTAPKWGFIISKLQEMARVKRLAEFESVKRQTRKKIGGPEPYSGDMALVMADANLCSITTESAIRRYGQTRLKNLVTLGRVDRQEAKILYEAHLNGLRQGVRPLLRSEEAWNKIGRPERGPKATGGL